MIASGDDHRVDLRVVQDVPEVRDPAVRAGLLNGLGDALGVRVADIGHAATVQAGEILAQPAPAPAAADDADVETVVGPEHAAHRGSQSHGRRRQAQTRFLQERSTIGWGHLFTSSAVRTAKKDSNVA